MKKKKKSFKQWKGIGGALRSTAKPIDHEDVSVTKGRGPAQPKKKIKNDKFIGHGADNAKRQVSANKAQKSVDKNKKLMKDFDGPRTFKDKDGKVRPTKAWAAHLKKNGSEVVAKSRLKRDHITQMTNAWHKRDDKKSGGAW
jgi:hypothetical protein